MARTLGQVTEGQLVKLNENGVLTEFYVACHDYESGLNGPGRTLLVRKEKYQDGEWNNTNSSAYADSTIDSWMNGTYKNKLDPWAQAAAGATKFYYTPMGGNTSVSTLERAVFALSITELGLSNSDANVEGTALFMASSLTSNIGEQWTRTPQKSANGYSITVADGGYIRFRGVSSAYAYRPCLTLPSTLYVLDDNSVSQTLEKTTLLRSVPVGSVVKLNESGAPVNYIVVHQGKPGDMYDDSCDGTWVLRKDIKELGAWNSTNVNTLPNSTIMQTMASYLSLLDSGIQSVVKTVKIPYCVGNGSSTVNSGASGLECKIFPLSWYELGWNDASSAQAPIDGAKLSYFESGESLSANEKRKATLNGEGNFWLTRSQRTNDSLNVWHVMAIGARGYDNAGDKYGLRPAMVLPHNLIVLPDGTLSPGSTITVPALIMQGNEVPVSWTAIDGADSYTLQRKADSGEWEQIYSGPLTTYTDTAGEWTTVQYQVQAVFDGTPSAWSQSDVVEVVSKSSVAISGQDGDMGTITSDIPYSVTTDTGKKISLTRTVNGVLVARLEVDSGFSGSIPVLDLPAGTGTIVITATVQTDSDPVTVTRTWTYTKQAQTFPGSGGVGQLTQDGQNVFPLTLAEAVKAISGPWGGNLSTALDKLAKAAIYTTAGDFADLWGNIIPTVKIETGSYVGTGTYGATSPTTLVSSFAPKIVVVQRTSTPSGEPYFSPSFFINGVTQMFNHDIRGTTANAIQFSWSENQVSWYSAGGNASIQLNASGQTYNYIIFG